MTEQFIQMVSERNPFQKKLLKDWQIRKEEKQELESILEFYTIGQGYSLEYLVEAYTFINTMVMEETYFFEKNKRYRNSTFEEVNEIVYQNDEYMKKYMIGLCISDYIWIQHLKMIRWFEQILKEKTSKQRTETSKRRYLEIGPGLGQYLIRALAYGGYDDYLAADLSPTSVEQCKRYLNYRGIDETEYKMVQKDFFAFSSEQKYDCIVMGEVLEHVEQPLEMLKKIRSLLNDEGMAFITTVINAPAIDHISLFRSEEEVLALARQAGFLTQDHICVTAGDIPMERAVKRRYAINIAMVLKGRAV